jgi:hypothetical protein
MVSGMRDNVLALACLRHGLPAVHGRGFDDLPSEVTRRLQDGLVRSLDLQEIRRAFRAMCAALQVEIGFVDAALANRLAGPFALLVTEQEGKRTAGTGRP